MATPAITAYDPNGTPFQTSRPQFERLFKPAGCTLTAPTKTRKGKNIKES